MIHSSVNPVAFVAVFLFFLAALDAQDIVFPDEQWITTDPEDVFLDPEVFEDIVARLDTNRVMIIRNGRALVIGDASNEIRQINSISKSVLSTVVGLLIEDGTIELSTPLSSYLPELTEFYPSANFEHFITQTSGFNEFLKEPATPLFTPPGSQFAYDGQLGTNEILRRALSAAAEKPYWEVFNMRVAAPLAMDDFRDSFGIWKPIGSFMSADDVARYGLLYLNGGNWNGEQLLNESWVEAATQVQVKDLRNHERSGANFVNQFGYGWWRFDRGWYEAIGSGNNQLSVSPTLGFVVVSLGDNGSGLLDSVLDQLVDASTPFEWDENGTGKWHDTDLEGNRRWVLPESGPQTSLPLGKAIVRSDNVEVARSLMLYSLMLEHNGSVNVKKSVEFDALDISVGSTARLDVNGTLNAEVINIAGQVEIGPSGKINVDDLSLVDDAHLVLSGQTKIVSMEQIGGSLLINGQTEIKNLRLKSGDILLMDSGYPAMLQGRVQISDSQLTFLIDSPSWNSPLTFSEIRAKPKLGGALILDLSPTFDPTELIGERLNLFDWSERGPSGEFTAITVPHRLIADTADLYTTGEILINDVLGSPKVAGDFNADSLFDVADLDELARRIQFVSTDNYYDVNEDGVLTEADLRIWVEDIKGTHMGDANLDGKVDLTDFSVVVDHFGRPGGWNQGDFTADGLISFPDFLQLAENFMKQPGDGAVAAVPEPRGAGMALLCTVLIYKRRR